jgi:uncharacterized protein YndB with AHSA1/START domain
MARASARSVPRPPVPPTGRVVRDRDGLELLVERRLPVDAAEAWRWLTQSARLSKWIGTWKGAPAVGGDLQFTMRFEKDAAAETVTILECEPESRFRLRWAAESTPWVVAVSIVEVDGSTTVYLSQRLSASRDAGMIGPGWEYYLDRLMAAVNGGAAPNFDDYFPSQRPYFERLAMDGDPVGWPAR